jgi:hypothetical protein
MNFFLCWCDTYYISILYNSEHSKKQMNKKKSHKHSNEELFNHKFHKTKWKHIISTKNIKIPKNHTYIIN